MICFHQKCPHCSARERLELEDDQSLPTQRELEVRPNDSSGAVHADPVDNYLTSNCTRCGAMFVVNFVVRERLYVSVLAREELVALKRPVKARPTHCSGCGREFNEQLVRSARQHLCRMCFQEIERLLAARRAA